MRLNEPRGRPTPAGRGCRVRECRGWPVRLETCAVHAPRGRRRGPTGARGGTPMTRRRCATPTSRRCPGTGLGAGVRPRRLARRLQDVPGRQGRWPGSLPLHRGAPRLDVPGEALDDADVRRLRHRRGHQRPLQELLRAGGTGLSVAFDLPTLMGPDSDDPLALGEVGQCGVAVDTLADMEDLFAGIDLGAVTTSMTINSPAPIVHGHVRRRRGEGGRRAHRLGGTLQNDILKEYQAQKEFIFPPRPSMRLVTDVVALLRGRDAASGIRCRCPATTSARPARRPSQELAFTLANGFAYVEAGLGRRTRRRRLRAAASASSSTRTSTSSRRSPSTAPPGASGPAGCATATAPTTSGRCSCASTPRPPACRSTAQQPEVNIVRTAIEALAGRARRHPEPAHQLDGRGPRPAHGEGGPHRPAHPAGHRLRDRGDERGRSPGRFVVRRVAHRRDRARRPRRSSPTSTTWGEGSMLEGVLHGIEEQLVPGRDRRRRLRLRARAGVRPAGRGRGERLHRGQRRAGSLPSCTSGPRDEAQRKRLADVRQRRDRGRRRPRPGPGGRRRDAPPTPTSCPPSSRP